MLLATHFCKDQRHKNTSSFTSHWRIVTKFFLYTAYIVSMRYPSVLSYFSSIVLHPDDEIIPSVIKLVTEGYTGVLVEGCIVMVCLYIVSLSIEGDMVV